MPEVQNSEALKPIEGFGALWGFYNEINPRTGKHRWQHMERKRMTEIMLQIAESLQTSASIQDKAINWIADYGTI